MTAETQHKRAQLMAMVGGRSYGKSLAVKINRKALIELPMTYQGNKVFWGLNISEDEMYPIFNGSSIIEVWGKKRIIEMAQVYLGMIIFDIEVELAIAKAKNDLHQSIDHMRHAMDVYNSKKGFEFYLKYRK